VKKRVATIMQSLKVKYEAGEIAYPRTDNDFVKEKRYEFFAHPPIKIPYDPYAQPFGEVVVPLNKNTSLLLLSIGRLVKPSEAENFAQFIEEYFDEDMEPKREKEEDIQKISTVLRETTGRKIHNILEMEKSFFSLRPIWATKIENFYFVPSKRLQKQNLFFDSPDKEDLVDEDRQKPNFDTLLEAVKAFKKKRKMLLEKSKQLQDKIAKEKQKTNDLKGV